MHWYKRDPDAALAGMAELTMEERGAYNSILDLLYSRDGDVPDNDELVAKMIGCHWRSWGKLKNRLIELGKVWVSGGKITARRVQETLKEAAELSQKQRTKAARRWQKTENDNKNNEPVMPPGNASTSTSTSTSTTTKKERKTPAAKEPPEFNDFWMSVPKREGSNPRIPALKSYQKAIREGADPAQINAAAKRWARESLKTEPKFVAMAVTWLNQKRFEDYHIKPEAESNVVFDETTKLWEFREGYEPTDEEREAHATYRRNAIARLT